MKLIDFINERKQRGNLYHFTNIPNLKNILEDNELKTYQSMYEPGKAIKEDFYISLTRNPRARISEREHMQLARITLDGDKLSDNYKITPHLAFLEQWKGRIEKSMEKDPEHARLNYLRRLKWYKTEAEERVKGNIKNLDRYVEKIDILKGEIGSIISLQKKYPNIKFNLIDKW